MNPQKNRKIRNIAIVSLSSGIIGEPFVQFETEDSNCPNELEHRMRIMDNVLRYLVVRKGEHDTFSVAPEKAEEAEAAEEAEETAEEAPVQEEAEAAVESSEEESAPEAEAAPEE